MSLFFLSFSVWRGGVEVGFQRRSLRKEEMERLGWERWG